MMDKAVVIDHVQNVTGFDPNTLLPSKRVQVTYHVGSHGPFQLTTPPEAFNQEYIETETAKTAATLRAAGALKPGE